MSETRGVFAILAATALPPVLIAWFSLPLALICLMITGTLGGLALGHVSVRQQRIDRKALRKTHELV